MRAWLVTWEWVGDHAKREDKIAAIFDPRLSPERIREFVEIIYLFEYSSLSDRLAYARHKVNDRYIAKFMDKGGVSWRSGIHCGDNPFLLARLVDDLKVERDEQGKEKATWR